MRRRFENVNMAMGNCSSPVMGGGVNFNGIIL